MGQRKMSMRCRAMAPSVQYLDRAAACALALIPGLVCYCAQGTVYSSLG